jgi:hypothetical protein
MGNGRIDAKTVESDSVNTGNGNVLVRLAGSVIVNMVDERFGVRIAK